MLRPRPLSPSTRARPRYVTHELRPGRWAVTRLLPGGDLDTTFGVGGSTALPEYESEDTVWFSLSVTSAGAVRVAGVAGGVRDGETQVCCYKRLIAVAALTPTGHIDGSYGGGDAVVEVTSDETEQTSGDVVMHPDGSVTIASGPQLHRFVGNGTPDPRWTGSETFLEEFDPPSCGRYALAPWSRDGVLVVTFGQSCSPVRPIAVRAIDDTGRPDPLIPTPVVVPGTNGMDLGVPVVDATGRPVLELYANAGTSAPRLVRLLQDGSPDPTFVVPAGTGFTMVEAGINGRLVRVTTPTTGTQRLTRYLPGDPPLPLSVRFTSSALTVNGRYTPISGDFNGDGIGDLIWYAPGTTADSIWFGKRAGGFTKQSMTIIGSYVPIPGDYDGDGRTDLLLYGPGTKPDALWRSKASGGFTVSKLTVNGTYRPAHGDFNGDGREDVLWYAPGGTSDLIWSGKASGGFSPSHTSIVGTYALVPGDYNGDGRTDVILYGPGAARDQLWLARSAGGFTASALTINGSYRPASGDLNGDELDDVVWYGPGAAADSAWLSRLGGGFRAQGLWVGGNYVPVPGDVNGDGLTDLVWYAPGPTADRLYTTGIL